MITNTALIERLMRYVKIDTQSDEDSAPQPSTAKQHDLARLQRQERKPADHRKLPGPKYRPDRRPVAR